MRQLNLFIKRVVDFVGGLVGIILISPILLLCIIAIKVDSKGPAFFKQERLGKNGEKFNIIKFRTMVINAEHTGDGLKISTEEDFRITKVGKFFRKYSLDELPQLFNVISGTMSLVGPRPPVVYHPYNGYENYPEWAKKRFIMRPGMTGLVQVKKRASIPWDDRILIDNEYIDGFSIGLDIKILFLTVKQIIFPKGIYLNEKHDT